MPTKTSRNAPCPCGSGKKYKKCCLAKDEAAEASVAVSEVRLGPKARLSPKARSLSHAHSGGFAIITRMSLNALSLSTTSTR